MPTHVAGEGSMKSPVKREPKGRQIHHIEIKQAENGGHVVTHLFDNSGVGKYHMPEMHVFGPGEGDEALEHIAKHIGIPGAEEEIGEEEHQGNKEPIAVKA